MNGPNMISRQLGDKREEREGGREGGVSKRWPPNRKKTSLCVIIIIGFLACRLEHTWGHLGSVCERRVWRPSINLVEGGRGEGSVLLFLPNTAHWAVHCL